ncbi:MobQ family relaxase [Pseudomonas sp.]|uniref:MobQ family relaxase n=1 Tax=Pseudomonas sp. TaxID=306 RepID=UPI003C713F2D
MAIYRCEIKTVSRSQGASAVAGAAYRAGLDLADLRTGERHDYTRKQGVVASGILAPAGSPEWAQDPAQLWNAAEAAETRKNSVVAREFLVSLPHELTDVQRAELARDLTANLVERFGFAAMFASHAPDKNADERNHHVHILATTRRMEPTGLGAKTRELDDRKTGAVEEVRAKVASTINQHLERAGLSARVDHRSLLDQQVAAASAGDFARAAELDRQPEPKVGRTATAAARRGKRSPRAERVQRVRAENAQHAQAQADRFRELKTKAAAEGRLNQVDEQALHARALLEHRKETAVRFQQTANSLTAKAAVQARAPRSAPHQARPSMARPALVGGGQRGKGAAAIERASRQNIPNRQAELMAGEQVAKNLDELIEQLLKRARLALQQPDTTPLQRAAARTLIQRHEAMGQARQAYTDAKQARKQAHLDRRRAEADANVTPVPTDLRSKALRAVGLSTAEDRTAQAAQEQKRQATVQEQQARQARDTARLARNDAIVALDLAQTEFLVQFPPLFPSNKPAPSSEAKHSHVSTSPAPGQGLPGPSHVSPHHRLPPRP